MFSTNSNNNKSSFIDLTESKVPSNKFERAFGFAGLAAKLALSGFTQSFKNSFSGQKTSFASTLISAENAKTFAEVMCRMRGAALKLSQMISLQEKFLPKETAEILARVRDNADVMPPAQLQKVMAEELGAEWKSRFESFDEKPFAAASIGQVHEARLKTGERVAVKVQYPGVAESIESDLESLKWVVSKFDLFPKGLYIENIINVAKMELAQEVDYEKEAEKQRRFFGLLDGYRGVRVPKVFGEFCGKRVLTAEFMEGVSIANLADLDQAKKDELADIILDITLKEVFEFRFTQTDPNWSNFLYDSKTGTLSLIDFGASREYNKHFIDRYIQMVKACVQKKDEFILRHSDFLGFTTGFETEHLKNLHIKSGYALGDPFRTEEYDFDKQNLVEKLREYGSQMLKDRLTPPPSEAYTLHRKLSGSFLTCVKLGAKVKCKKMFSERFDTYDWEGVERDKYD